MARHRNIDWGVSKDALRTPSYEDVKVSVLMDIRDELQHLNRILDCENFQAIPRKLEAIRRNTAKPRKKKA